MNFFKSLVSKNSQSTKGPFGSGNRGRATTKTNTPPRPNMGPNTITKTNPSKSPALSNINFPPQSTKTDSKDFQVSHNPSNTTPTDLSLSSIMNVAVIPDEFGQPKEVKILVTKEQFKSIPEKLEFDYDNDFNEDLEGLIFKKLINEGKFSFVILSNEQKEEVTKTFLEKVESPKPSSSNNNSVASNVKITKEDVEFQDTCIEQVIYMIKQVKDLNGSDDDKRTKITVGFNTSINPSSHIAASGLFNLVANELLSSSEPTNIALRKFLSNLEGIEESRINKSLYLKSICHRLIKHFESNDPVHLKDTYLWEKKLSSTDINSYM